MLKAAILLSPFFFSTAEAVSLYPKSCGTCGTGYQWTCHFDNQVPLGTNPFRRACTKTTSWKHHTHTSDRCPGQSHGGWTIIDDECNAQCSCTGSDCECSPNYCVGGVCGDPHIKTWNGTWYDFHGECDLVFLHAPNHGNGVGLDIHIRTVIREAYSFVESAAIKIGEDLLEVSSHGEYRVNGVEDAMDGEGDIGFGPSEYPLVTKRKGPKEVDFFIYVEENEAIQVHVFRDIVSVKMLSPKKGNFEGSTGLMGEFETGIMYARDGETVLDDPNEFGQEWQVLSTEAKLFEVNRAPQHPHEKCVMPAVVETSRRRLGEGIARESAEKACAHLGSHFDLCVSDVIAFGDLELAQSGMY